MTRHGIVVALSGVDCAGKSTQRNQLMERLRSWGYAPIAVWSRPGYSRGLAFIKRTLRVMTTRRGSARCGVAESPGRYPRRAANLRHSAVRWLWLTAALLDLLWVYCLWIRILKTSGRMVVCDRYLLDCLVDFRVNFPDDRVEERFLCRLLRRLYVCPDAAFCLLIPAEESMKRSRGKGRFHWESLEVLEARARAYRCLASELGVQVLDGERPQAEIAHAFRHGVAAILSPVGLHYSGSV